MSPGVVVVVVPVSIRVKLFVCYFSLAMKILSTNLRPTGQRRVSQVKWHPSSHTDPLIRPVSHHWGLNYCYPVGNWDMEVKMLHVKYWDIAAIGSGNSEDWFYSNEWLIAINFTEWHCDQQFVDHKYISFVFTSLTINRDPDWFTFLHSMDAKWLVK